MEKKTGIEVVDYLNCLQIWENKVLLFYSHRKAEGKAFRSPTVEIKMRTPRKYRTFDSYTFRKRNINLSAHRENKKTSQLLLEL